MISYLSNLFDRLPRATGAALIMIFVAMLISLMHAAIRITTSELHPFEVAFFRNFFGFLVLFPALMRTGRSALQTSRWPAHLLRTMFQFISMTAFFFGISMLPLAKASALMFTAPLFATIFAVFILGEKIRARRVSALALGFIGMLIIVRPAGGTIDLGSILIIIAAAGLACMLISIKSLSDTESSLSITAIGSMMMTVISIGPAIMIWQWPTIEQSIWLFMVGAIGSLAHYLVAQAMSRAEASELMSYDFTKLVWASFLGFLFFSEIPSWWTLAGGLLIFSSTAYIAYRETRIGKVAITEESVNERF
jgi:drug/metabolite transporter (DMT)-like permease